MILTRAKGRSTYLDAFTGAEYISVTTAVGMTIGDDQTRWLMKWAASTPDYEAQSIAAMNVGSFVHAKLEDYFKEGLISEDFNDELAHLTPAFDAYEAYCKILDWAQSNVLFTFEAEKQVRCDTLMLAGTVDLLADVKDYGLSVIDFKFSKKPTQSRAHALQLKCYQQMLVSMGIETESAMNLFAGKKKVLVKPIEKWRITEEEIELIARLAHIRNLAGKEVADENEE